MACIFVPGLSGVKCRYKYASGVRSPALDLGVSSAPPKWRVYPDPPGRLLPGSESYAKVVARVPEARDVAIIHYDPFSMDIQDLASDLLFESFRLSAGKSCPVYALGEGLGEILLRRAMLDPRLRLYAGNVRLVE